jgi:hypothetical protein
MTDQKFDRRSQRPLAVDAFGWAGARPQARPAAAGNPEPHADNPDFEDLPRPFQARIDAKFQRGIELGERRDRGAHQRKADARGRGRP